MAPERTTAEWYRTFGEIEARSQSPIFESWALGIAGDPETVGLIDTLPLQKRQPNLIFAISRLLGAPVGAYENYRAWLHAHWAAVAAETPHRMTQTNEPRRCAALIPALGLIGSQIDGQVGGPIALLELGASAGLCLYPDRYSYRYGEGDWLHPDEGPSEVRIDAETSGPVPVPTRMPNIVWRAGIDLEPLDVRNPADVEWLETLVWPEQEARLERIRAAIDVVKREPPLLERGNAIDRLAELAAKAPPHATLVVVTSAMLVYIPYLERMRLVGAIRELCTTRNHGATQEHGVTREHGAHWISLDGIGVLPDVDARHPDPQAGRFTLSLDGEPLADVGPHGQYVSWIAHAHDA